VNSLDWRIWTPISIVRIWTGFTHRFRNRRFPHPCQYLTR